MLKHVQVSPLRSRADSLSMRSSASCASSLCGSPEPPNEQFRSHSRASSFSSLNETIPQSTIKIYTSCLRQDIEYKTLGVSYESTSKNIIQQVLRRCKMRQRDPRLFYLTMEVTVRRPGVKTVLDLDDEARPALLQACHPKGDSRFCLQLKPGGLIRVHTSALQPTSQYKSLVIAEETTSDELLSLLLSCYNSGEPVEQFSLYEVCPGQEYQRKLHPDDLPLRTQIQRKQRGELCHFLVRRNPNYPRRRQLLPPISEAKHLIINPNLNQRLSLHSSSFPMSLPTATSLNDIVVDATSPSKPKEFLLTESNCTACDKTDKPDSINNNNNNKINDFCLQCKNSFKSCDFCKKNTKPSKSNDMKSLSLSLSTPATPSYNPVYNIREIRTVCHSFSSLGIDKKLMDIERYNNNNNTSTNRNSIVKEAVNTDPSKGVGNFVYI